MKPTILLIGWRFYPQTGGAETIMLLQARELVKRGYRIIVLTGSLDGVTNSEEEHLGILVIRRNWFTPVKCPNAHVVQEDCKNILTKYQPQLVHFHNGSYPISVQDRSNGVALIISMVEVIQRFNLPIIEHAHNAQLRGAEQTKELRNIAWNWLIFVSDFVKDEWIRLGYRALNSSTVYNGIDIDAYAEALPSDKLIPYAQDGRVLLFFPARVISLTTGDMNSQKNIAYLLQACAGLKAKGQKDFLILAILNTTDLNDLGKKGEVELRTLISTLGLQDNIAFIPPIRPDEMAAYYAGIDILAVPASNETFGLMYVEAMAAGKVVIGAQSGGPLEYIRTGENGYLVDTENPDNLTLILEVLLQEPALRRRIGKQAQLDARQFSYQKMVDAIEVIYTTLLA